ncbi:pantoate--beta-alanine ligase [Corynebacterium breve]|uniref:Pantothenate synthetase n=1 Tax=Corynebacterium breve TaxID=3049799 RepID=A0ABY8VDN8_9CORY|nr:pantoate--beta-alanine ligase [Corynebacterium breve]WIM67618.1 pantoate--beta-alanine ligase [Corynebacterium breve]
MQVVTTPAQLHAALASQPGIVGLVPTMGALHDGHGTLIDQAQKESEVVVVSTFVNPLQFTNLGDCDDYRLYPRDLAADEEFCRQHHVDILFAPTVEDMYPDTTPMIWVRTGRMGEILEGASRPGHFDGVATVVAKLFNMVHPYRAYFGQKDAQQAAIIRRMVKDLNMPVQITTVPIARTPEGLAQSSRNQRLSDEGRTHALALSQALNTLRKNAKSGKPIGLSAVREELAAAPGITLDYLTVVTPTSLAELDDDTLVVSLEEPALALVAAEVEGVRLIDNMILA